MHRVEDVTRQNASTKGKVRSSLIVQVNTRSFTMAVVNRFKVMTRFTGIDDPKIYLD
jgi:hypothetical protein